MGANSSVSKFKSEYDMLHTSCLEDIRRRNRSFDENIDIKEYFLNLCHTQTRKPQPKKKKQAKNKKINFYDRNGTVYKMEDQKIPVNLFFDKLFGIRNEEKARCVEEALNNSDLNFSDLESLRISSDEESEFDFDQGKKTIGKNYSFKFDEEDSSDEQSPDISNLSQFSQESFPDHFKKDINNLRNNNEDCISEVETTSGSKAVNPHIMDSSSTRFSTAKTTIKLENLKDSLNPLRHKSDNLRSNYYTKLVMKNVLPSKDENAIEKNSFFIFDWDDTLFCTSFLMQLGILDKNVKLPEKIVGYIKVLDNLTADILKFTIRHGSTYIITNAMKGWVELSCEKFYPETFKLLENIVVISARNEFEKQCPTNAKEWKYHTFSNISNHFNRKTLTNIVSFGDNINEIEAGHLLSSKFENCYLKSIKFREKPKPQELIKELKLIREKIEEIYSCQMKCFTINVEKKPKADKKSISKDVDK